MPASNRGRVLLIVLTVALAAAGYFIWRHYAAPLPGVARVSPPFARSMSYSCRRFGIVPLNPVVSTMLVALTVSATESAMAPPSGREPKLPTPNWGGS